MWVILTDILGESFALFALLKALLLTVFLNVVDIIYIVFFAIRESVISIGSENVILLGEKVISVKWTLLVIA